MDEREWLGQQFEDRRTRLKAVAYRMLGSSSEAEDAVQETWLRLARSEVDAIDNLDGWLTTVVARTCLDVLRSRRSRRIEPYDFADAVPADLAAASDPEDEAVLADSVGLALLVVLDTLSPAERLAFVLHDNFGVPFEEIASLVGRTPAAARQLASRARRRVRGASSTVSPGDLRRQRELVDAYMAAIRQGNFDALISVLHPDVVLRADAQAAPAGRPLQLRGALAVARGARGARARAGTATVALVNGNVGMIVAPEGQLRLAVALSFADDRIVGIDVVADPERLAELDLALA